MTDSASPSVSVSLSEPTNVSTVLDRAGIDYVTVHEQRLLAIYHTGIFCSIENGRQQRDHAVMSLGKRGREDGNGSRLARPR